MRDPEGMLRDRLRDWIVFCIVGKQFETQLESRSGECRVLNTIRWRRLEDEVSGSN